MRFLYCLMMLPRQNQYVCPCQGETWNIESCITNMQKLTTLTGLSHGFFWRRGAEKLTSHRCSFIVASDAAFTLIMAGTQWAHSVKMTSYQRRCDVITSHRRWYDVILMLCACWEEGGTGLFLTLYKCPAPSAIPKQFYSNNVSIWIELS